ncbi:MAG: acetoacetate--CoA ligase [Saprospiraceae bacterium]
MERNNTPKIIWKPDPQEVASTQLWRYQRWLEQRHRRSFENYHALWSWSVEDPGRFWQGIWAYFDIKGHTPYSEVLESKGVHGARWFPGSTLNYAEHIFRAADPNRPALLFQSEGMEVPAPVSWEELSTKTAAFAEWLRAHGVGKGDRVVAWLPNTPEATIAFLATCSLGAIWSSCSPDFGTESVLDRFRQIAPKVLLATDAYRYGGKSYSKKDALKNLLAGLPSLEHLVLVPSAPADEISTEVSIPVALWETVTAPGEVPLAFTPVPFDHPIWILYSSGTTGLPKAIAHGHGGVLLEHYKYLAFHNDVQPGERFFWFTTTGWMMWNFLQSSLLLGATAVLYDGSPGWPNLGVLWELADRAGIHHFGTSAPFLMACQKAGLEPATSHDLESLRSVSSTGAPLPPESFSYVTERIKSGVWLCSMSGGTDVCTAFVGGCPELPVYEGEIQCRALGCALYAFDDHGNPLADQVGEMVITQPMPSMPVFFWNDPEGKKYFESYFDWFPGVWRHGDWVKITSRDTLVILGRSDATLNRQGIRIGTAEIYNALDQVSEVRDSLVVGVELSGGRYYMPLYVVLAEGIVLTDQLRQKIIRILRDSCSPRHVPDEILEVPEIPYTLSGKKMELPVKKILMGVPSAKAANAGAMRNPDALDFFASLTKPFDPIPPGNGK